MSPLKRFSKYMATVFVLSLAIPSARAQAVDPTLERGMKPYGTFEGGAIDSISTTNGDLNLHIPLVSYPQRGGKLHLDFYVKFNNNSYTYIPSNSPPCTHQPFICSYGTTVNGPGMEISTDYKLRAYVSGTIPPSTGPYATLATPDGSQHEMTAVSGGWRTIDATGYLCLNNCGTIIDRNGIRYSTLNSGYIPQRIEDPNGNYITATSTSGGLITSYTDTMGRNIPVPPDLGSSSGFTYTSDTSRCTGTLTTATAFLWSPPGYQGGQTTYKICYANVYYGKQTCLKQGATVTCHVTLQHNALIQSIVLPNNTTWTFQYDSADPNVPGSTATGNLLQITFPTGGYIKYGWGAVYICQGGSTGTGTSSVKYTFAVASRKINSDDGTGEHTTSYSFVNVSAATNNSPYSTSSTDPVGNKTVHTLSAIGGTCSFYETQTQALDSTGVLQKTVAKDYTGNVDPLWAGSNTQSSNVVQIRVTTTWPSGRTSKIETDYDTTTPFLYGDPTAERDYDYGNGIPGALLRKITTTYAWQSNSNYLTANILSLPSQVVTYDGNGNRVAETDSTYDNPSYLQASNITTQHEAAPGPVRGNPTFLQRWVNTTNSFITSTTTMFDTGTLPNATDPLSHAVTRAYSASFAGAYVTTVTNALTQSANHNYDFNTGLLTSTTDANNLTTSISYDNMWRVSQVTHPDGGTESTSHQESSFPFTATLTKQINSAQSEITTNVFDGLGRLTQSQQTSDPQGTVYTNTAYDALGRVATVSNPYRSGTDPTTSAGTTTYAYDALGRKLSETYPDNSVLTTAYCGPSTLVTDPTGKWRRSRVNGLGRLVEVDEPNAPGASVNSNGCPGTGEPIWITTYGYDTLGNLTSVLQNGSHQRSFTYDSLSRLLTATNPETGTITYAYNNDGALISKTDVRNITTNYSPSESPIDVLHRVTKITYSNGDPSITYAYDQANCLGLSACQNIGHRTSMTDAAGSETWAYQIDKINFPNSPNIQKDQRTTNGITKPSTYYADLAGNVTQAVYPTSRVVNYTYDSADRPSTAVDGSNGITYASDFQIAPTGCLTGKVCYTPQGTFYALSIGQSTGFTGLNLTHSYNSRLQPNEFKASSTGGNAIDITYGFVDPATTKNAGHVYGITNNLDTTRSQTFTYDQLNRITGALTTSTHATSPTHCWGETYTLDAWANLNSIAATTNSNYTGCTQESGFSTTADGNNHLPIFSYDSSGNTQSDGTISYTWNAESQLKSATNSGTTTNYTYDGDGRRVSKVGSKLYWYGSGGDILAETNAAGATTAEYIFFGGKRVAMLPAGSTAQFYVEDLLGTSRVMTTNTGIVCYDADFYPFGGERTPPYTNTCPQNNYKFEGKERDTETLNDDFGARYYSNRFGRWLSADWSAVPVAVPYANLTNPQTLNLYGMVADDPESFADLDGHCCEGALEAGEQIYEIPTLGTKILGGLIIAGAVVGSVLSNPGFRDAAVNVLANGGDPAVDAAMATFQVTHKSDEHNPSDSKPGTLGKADHQQTAEEERAKRPGSEREATIPTPGGEKNSRRGDVVVKDKSGKVTEVVQVIRPNKNGTAPAREVRAANDIATTGPKVTFVPVRPIIRKPRTVDVTPPEL